ncbi:MAG: TSUP family transporter [Marinifilaceae bacterium]
MTYFEIGIIFFTIAFLASLTGRGGGLLYLTILINEIGFSTETRILSFLLIIATSLPHLPKAFKKTRKSMITQFLLPSLSAYLLIGFTGSKANGLLYAILFLFIGIVSLLLLWTPPASSAKRSRFFKTGGFSVIFSFFASGISGYVGLSPSLLLVPFLSNLLKLKMSEFIPYLHFQNLLTVSVGLVGTALAVDSNFSLEIVTILLLIIIVLTGSYVGSGFLKAKNEFWMKVIFTLLTASSLLFTLWNMDWKNSFLNSRLVHYPNLFQKRNIEDTDGARKNKVYMKNK